MSSINRGLSAAALAALIGGTVAPAEAQETTTLACDPSGGSGGLGPGVHDIVIRNVVVDNPQILGYLDQQKDPRLAADGKSANLTVKAQLVVGDGYDPATPAPAAAFYLHGDEGGRDPNAHKNAVLSSQYAKEQGWIFIAPHEPIDGRGTFFYPQVIDRVFQYVYNKYNVCRSQLYGGTVSGGSFSLTSRYEKLLADHPAFLSVQCQFGYLQFQIDAYRKAVDDDPTLLRRAGFSLVLGENDHATAKDNRAKSVPLLRGLGFEVESKDIPGAAHCAWSTDTEIRDYWKAKSETIVIDFGAEAPRAPKLASLLSFERRAEREYIGVDGGEGKLLALPTDDAGRQSVTFDLLPGRSDPSDPNLVSFKLAGSGEPGAFLGLDQQQSSGALVIWTVGSLSLGGTLTPEELAELDRKVTFKVVPGLARASWSSYESVAAPGSYLSGVDDLFVTNQANEGDLNRRAATFAQRKPLFDGSVVTASIQSFAKRDQYFLGRDALIVGPAVEQDWLKPAQVFKIRRGLATPDDPNSVSFESAWVPGRFLVSTGESQVIWLQDDLEVLDEAGREAFRRTATFHVRPGLADANAQSYEALDQPGFYLRNRADFPFATLDQDDGSDGFKGEATWLQLPPLTGDQPITELEEDPDPVPDQPTTEVVADVPEPESRTVDDPVEETPAPDLDGDEFLPDDPEPEGLKGVTAVHNAWRAVVGQDPLAWSAAVAAEAQAYADSGDACAPDGGLVHATGRLGIRVRWDPFLGCDEADRNRIGYCPCTPGEATAHGTRCYPIPITGTEETVPSLLNTDPTPVLDCPEAEKADGFCTCTSSPGDFTCTGDGENLAGFFGSPLTGVDNWGSEKQIYDIKSQTCGGACGHYTQMVWDQTKQLGCGVGKCPSYDLLVCRYRPAGNFPRRPYEPSADVTFRADLVAIKDTALTKKTEALRSQNLGGLNPAGVSKDARTLIGFSKAAGTVGDHVTDAQLRLYRAPGAEGSPNLAAHPLPNALDWPEGNSRGPGDPDASGEGATWNCRADTDVGDADDGTEANDCFVPNGPWEGAGGGALPFGDATGPAQAHAEGATGRVIYDVTDDVKQPSAVATHQWVIKKVTESGAGVVLYNTREGRRKARVPTLRLEIRGND